MIQYFQQYQSQIWGWLGWHVRLAGIPLVLGLIISLPLGWLANRYKLAYPAIVSISGLLYTIPSLALFILLPGILKTKILDPNNVIVALTIYTVALLVRVVADGLAEVPTDVEQAATAMGYRSFGRLIKVELPIAVPVIAAGLRVAAVSNVSLVSVSALLGVPELGALFNDGLQREYLAPILLGILFSLLLALAFDVVIQVLTWAFTPWRRVVRPA